MRNERVAGMALVLMASALPPASADVWDTTGDDAANATRNELLHGSDQVHDLGARPGPVADVDWYRLSQQRYSSYQIVVDAGGGDLGGSGPILERVASDGSTVLQASVPAGAGGSRSLSFENAAGAVVSDQRVRVRSGGCGSDCGSEDAYRIRALDTTASISRFNNSGTQITLVVLQNTAASVVDGHINFWNAAGALLLSQPFSIAGRGSFVFNSSLTLPGTNGSATVSHTGAYGQVAGRATSVEPSTGFTFDTELRPRTVPAQGSAGGRGVAALGITPPSWDYGTVFIGGGPTVTFTVKNLGGGVPSGVLATALTGPDAAQFSVTNDTCAGNALPAGASCTLEGTLSPSTGGPKSAVLTVAGPGGGASASLVGSAVSGNPVFVTSIGYLPDIGGLPAADAICQSHAAAAGLPPVTYRAWLSTSTVDAESRLGTARGFIRTDGRPFADTKAGLIASNVVFNPIVTDEFGATVSVDDVWTGTTSSGTGGTNNCADWTSSLPSISGTAGHSRGGPVSWTQHSFPSCDTPLPIYCFGINAIVPVTIPPLPDRLAFVTSATFALGPGGIGAADVFCQVDGCGAPGCAPFKAYLATTTGNAASRFTLTSYTRIDEVPVGGAAELDSAGPLQSGIWQHIGGGYIGGTILNNRAAWTGSFAANAPGTAATTCNDWTSNVGTGAYIGDPTLSNFWWFGRAAGQDCSVPRRLYCLLD